MKPSRVFEMKIKSSDQLSVSAFDHLDGNPRSEEWELLVEDFKAILHTRPTLEKSMYPSALYSCEKSYQCYDHVSKTAQDVTLSNPTSVWLLPKPSPNDLLSEPSDIFDAQAWLFI